jgi:hypothetical protein
MGRLAVRVRAAWIARPQLMMIDGGSGRMFSTTGARSLVRCILAGDTTTRGVAC